MSKTARILVKGSSLRIFSYFAQVAVSICLTPFIICSLGDRMYGFWALVGAFIGYYGLLDFGLSDAVNRYIASAIGAKDYDECNRVFNTAFILYFLFGITALFVSVLISALTHLFIKNPGDAALFVKVIFILGLNMAIELPLRAFRGVLTSQLRYDIMSMTELLTLVFRTALIILVLTTGYQVLAMAVVTLLSSIPQKLLTIYFAKRNLPQVQINRKEWNASTARKLFSYSVYSFIWQISNILKFKVDLIVVTIFLGLSAVTHYRIGSMLAFQMQAFMIATLGFMIPVFSRLYGKEDYENIKKTFFFVNKISIYIASFLGFGLIFWGETFIQKWVGPDYLDAYPVLLILVAGILFAFFQVPGLDFLLGTTGYKFVGIINVIEGLCNLLLSLVLVRFYGLVGVALGTLIPITIIKFFIQPIYVSRTLHVQISEYIRKVVRPILIVVLSLLLPAFISELLAIPDYRVLFMLGFISLVIYSLVLWIFGFNSSEIGMIRDSISLHRPKIQVSQ